MGCMLHPGSEMPHVLCRRLRRTGSGLIASTPNSVFVLRRATRISSPGPGSDACDDSEHLAGPTAQNPPFASEKTLTERQYPHLRLQVKSVRFPPLHPPSRQSPWTFPVNLYVGIYLYREKNAESLTFLRAFVAPPAGCWSSATKAEVRPPTVIHLMDAGSPEG